MNYADYESWLALYRHLLPDKLRNVLEKDPGQFELLFNWKEYERIASPKLRALLYRQYPEFKQAHKSFEPRFERNIAHTIFELSEGMNLIVRKNRENIPPEAALLKLYPILLKSKPYWRKPRGIEEADERYKPEMWAAFNRQQEYYTQFIDTLQEDLLRLYPELLNMAPAWWDVYFFYFRSQCDQWKYWNDKYSFLVKNNFTASWIKKDYDEVYAIIKSRERNERKKKK